MDLSEKILTNIVFAILLTSCCLLLSITLLTTFAMDSVLITYAIFAATLRPAFYYMLSKLIHCVIVPAVLLVLTAVYWIESQRIDIANFVTLCSRALTEDLEKIWKAAATPSSLPVGLQQVCEFVKDYNISFVRADLVTSRTRARTKEEDRLRRFIDNLETLEVDDLPENMTTEHALLLSLTRMAAVDGKGLIQYRLSEKHGPTEPAVQAKVHQYEILQHHPQYYKLHKSESNLFRLDEPDCAICYGPLEFGEAMLTHETCHRTFHTVCFNNALLKDRVCPYDRERLMVRRKKREPVAIVNTAVIGGIEQQLDIDPHNPGPVAQNVEPQWLQDQREMHPRVADEDVPAWVQHFLDRMQPFIDLHQHQPPPQAAAARVQHQPHLEYLEQPIQGLENRPVRDIPLILEAQHLGDPLQQVQAPENLVLRAPQPRQDRRPARDRPHRDARGRWRPTRP